MSLFEPLDPPALIVARLTPNSSPASFYDGAVEVVQCGGLVLRG